MYWRRPLGKYNTYSVQALPAYRCSAATTVSLQSQPLHVAQKFKYRTQSRHSHGALQQNVNETKPTPQALYVRRS